MTVAATSASSGSPSPFAVFRSRNFSLMWSAQLISTIGDALATIAASIVIYRMTGSAASVALMLLVTALPSLGLGLFAGVVVDRCDRRKIMMAVDLTRALLVVLIPGLRQERTEWKRTLHLLRRAPSAPQLGIGHPATTADLDSLVARLPALTSLTATERRDLVEKGSIFDATSGDIVLRQDETGDEAYFVLRGRLVAGFTDKGEEDRYLSTMTAGDFFGEIAALKASLRTANVVAEDDSTLYQIPGDTLHQLMDNPAMSEIVLTKMTECLNRSNLGDLPKSWNFMPLWIWSAIN